MASRDSSGEFPHPSNDRRKAASDEEAQEHRRASGSRSLSRQGKLRERVLACGEADARSGDAPALLSRA